MIVFIQILIILALIQVNIILAAKVKPVVKDASDEVKQTVDRVMHGQEPDQEYQKWLKILDNIDSYDGTGKGQLKI